MLAASWQASALVVLVLVAQRLLGARLNPRWRYALWLLVVLRLLMPVVPESTLSLFRFFPTSPMAFRLFADPYAEKALHPSEPLPPVKIIQPPPTSSLDGMRYAASFNLDSLYAHDLVNAMLTLVWLAGVALFATLTGLVNFRFARHIADAPEMNDPPLEKLFREAKAELDIQRAIRLVASTQVSSPAIMGLFTPALLLPADVRSRFDDAELRLIFLHELAHLKRGDVIVQALIAVLQIVHWFNPVLWFAFHRMRIDREPATDALVLSRAGEEEKERYGLMLIKLLEHFNRRHSLATLVGILEDKDQFKQRFSLIARFTSGAYGWSLLGVVSIAILGAVCLTKAKATDVLAAKVPAQPTTAHVEAKTTDADVRIEIHLLQMAEEDYQANRDAINAAAAKGDYKGAYTLTGYSEMHRMTSEVISKLYGQAAVMAVGAQSTKQDKSVDTDDPLFQVNLVPTRDGEAVIRFFAQRQDDAKILRTAAITLIEGQPGWYSEGQAQSYIESAVQERKNNVPITRLTAKSVFIGLNTDITWTPDKQHLDTAFQITTPKPIAQPQPETYPKQDFDVVTHRDSGWDMAPGKAHAFWIPGTNGWLSMYLTKGWNEKDLYTKRSPHRIAAFITTKPYLSDATSTHATPTSAQTTALQNAAPALWSPPGLDKSAGFFPFSSTGEVPTSADPNDVAAMKNTPVHNDEVYDTALSEFLPDLGNKTNNAGVGFTLTVPVEDSPYRLTLHIPHDTSLGAALDLINAHYPIRYKYRGAGDVIVWQVSHFETAFNQKAEETKIDLDLDKVAPAAAMRKIQDASAKAGFNFSNGDLDPYERLKNADPITLHGHGISVADAFQQFLRATKTCLVYEGKSKGNRFCLSSPVGDIPIATRPLPGSPSVTLAPYDLRVQYLAIDLAESDYQSHRDYINEAVQKGQYLTLKHFPSCKEVARMASPTKSGKASGMISGPDNPSIEIECTPTRVDQKFSLTGKLIFNSIHWTTGEKGRNLTLAPIANGTFPLETTLVPTETQTVLPEGILEPGAALRSPTDAPRRLFLFMSVWPYTATMTTIPAGSSGTRIDSDEAKDQVARSPNDGFVADHPAVVHLKQKNLADQGGSPTTPGDKSSQASLGKDNRSDTDAVQSKVILATLEKAATTSPTSQPETHAGGAGVKGQVKIGFRLCEIDEVEYSAAKSKIDAAIEKGDVSLLDDQTAISSFAPSSVFTSPARRQISQRFANTRIRSISIPPRQRDKAVHLSLPPQNSRRQTSELAPTSLRPSMDPMADA